MYTYTYIHTYMNTHAYIGISDGQVGGVRQASF